MRAEEFTREQLGRMVHILGNGCGADLALREMKRRESEGEPVACYWTGNTFVVGPPLPYDKEPQG